MILKKSFLTLLFFAAVLVALYIGTFATQRHSSHEMTAQRYVKDTSQFQKKYKKSFGVEKGKQHHNYYDTVKTNVNVDNDEDMTLPTKPSKPKGK